jgi:hypothetical protein
MFDNVGGAKTGTVGNFHSIDGIKEKVSNFVKEFKFTNLFKTKAQIQKSTEKKLEKQNTDYNDRMNTLEKFANSGSANTIEFNSLLEDLLKVDSARAHKEIDKINNLRNQIGKNSKNSNLPPIQARPSLINPQPQVFLRPTLNPEPKPQVQSDKQFIFPDE